MVLNYGLHGLINEDNINNISYFIAADHSYGYNNHYNCGNIDVCGNIVQAHFDSIAGMGFNTVRVVGLGAKYVANTGLLFPFKKYNFRPGFNERDQDRPIDPNNPADPGMLAVLAFYDKVLELAAAASPHPLQVILLVKGQRSALNATEVDLRSAFLAAVAAHLRNSPHKNALMAYDLFNEPCYHLDAVKTKEEACQIIASWYDVIKLNDPNSLVTIGNCSTGDIFAFDPSILKVDFNSMHYYPLFGKNEDRTQSAVQQRVRTRTANDLYWFSQASTVPWIVGETGFSASRNWGIADGLMGTLDNQRDYAAYSLDAVCNCGACGYSWWQFKDVHWSMPGNSSYGNNFFGLLERGALSDPHTVKQPAVNVFRNYIPIKTGDCPVDYSPTFDANRLYYNPYSHPRNTANEIARHVTDPDGNPIKNALVNVWTLTAPGVTSSDHTFTDANGYFIAIPAPASQQGHTPKIIGIKISAPGASELYRWDPANIEAIIPAIIQLDKIKDHVAITGQTVSNGQTKKYKGWQSLTVSNTHVGSGGNAVFTSAKSIRLQPGFTAAAGSRASMYIAPFGCDVWVFSGSKSIVQLSGEAPYGTEKSITLEFGAEKNTPENGVAVFPNPASGMLTIQLRCSSQQARIEAIIFYDTLGRKIAFWQKTADRQATIDISQFTEGIYFVEIKTSTKTYYQKLIKN